MGDHFFAADNELGMKEWVHHLNLALGGVAPQHIEKLTPGGNNNNNNEPFDPDQFGKNQPYGGNNLQIGGGPKKQPKYYVDPEDVDDAPDNFNNNNNNNKNGYDNNKNGYGNHQKILPQDDYKFAANNNGNNWHNGNNGQKQNGHKQNGHNNNVYGNGHYNEYNKPPSQQQRARVQMHKPQNADQLLQQALNPQQQNNSGLVFLSLMYIYIHIYFFLKNTKSIKTCSTNI